MILFGAAPAHALAISAGRGSPQKRLHRSVGYMSGLSIPSRFMNIPTDGTENHTVSLDS